MSLAEAAAGVDGAFTSIPIIDLNKCDTPEGRLAAAQEIRDACMQVGTFYVQNHGIPQSCLDNALSAMKTYFSLPMATKMKLYCDAVTSFKGYSPPLEGNIDAANNDKGDFYEVFQTGWEEIETKLYDEKRADDDAMAAPNVWPTDDCPGFREAMLKYYHAAVNVGTTLFPLFALALGLPGTYFDETWNPAASMRALHYPLQEGHPEITDDTPGIGAHTEYLCFAVLWQQPGIQALQVMNSEKRWINAPAIEDTLVIIIGDQLAFWTNDVFKSTVHRAINKSGRERFSIPLFFGANYHVNIEPIPSCVSADRPAKYTSITAGEYLSKRLKEMYHKV